MTAELHSLQPSDNSGQLPNNPAQEFLFDACEGQPKARQRRIIWRGVVAGFIDETDARIVADALGVEL